MPPGDVSHQTLYELKSVDFRYAVTPTIKGACLRNLRWQVPLAVRKFYLVKKREVTVTGKMVFQYVVQF